MIRTYRGKSAAQFLFLREKKNDVLSFSCATRWLWEQANYMARFFLLLTRWYYIARHRHHAFVIIIRMRNKKEYWEFIQTFKCYYDAMRNQNRIIYWHSVSNASFNNRSVTRWIFKWQSSKSKQELKYRVPSRFRYAHGI